MRAAVFEETEGRQVKALGFGVAVVVHDEFLSEVKRPPLFWFGPELARRIMRGHSPVLSEREVREANSAEGLNLLVWESCVRPEFEKRPDGYHARMNAFLELHRGFRWKEAITAQVDNAERLQWAIKSGGLWWNPTEGRYQEEVDEDPAQIAKSPHIVGMTRSIELARPAS